MAWYAESKRRKWYRINGIDMIAWYSEKLYSEWYNSLTEEQKQRIEDRKNRKREEEKRRARKAIAELAIMADLISNLGGGRNAAVDLTKNI